MFDGRMEVIFPFFTGLHVFEELKKMLIKACYKGIK
jgi:hypothetical protein